MYDTFFNLKLPPFENTPDPRFFYASEQHREALAALEYTIRMRKGFVLISGDIGSGKTTVAQTMRKRCGDQAQIVEILHGHRDGDGVLRQIVRTLGIKRGRNDDHGRLLERIRDYLDRTIGESARPLVLFVDEAQTLSDRALEELRLLSNFDNNRTKTIQIVLVGQPELRDRVAAPQMAALRQRIVLAKQLRPMGREETGQYIAHRIKVASADPESVRVTFADKAVSAIYSFTQGTPRLINVACDNCLLLAYVRESREVTEDMAETVVRDMVPSLGGTGRPASPLDDQPPLSLAGNL